MRFHSCDIRSNETPQRDRPFKLEHEGATDDHQHRSGRDQGNGDNNNHNCRGSFRRG